jgi:uroporphyrinogen decarboxylase
MRQAGRYLPEYRALREAEGDFVKRCLTPDIAVETTLQPIRRYGMDAAILFSDILILPYALGQDVRFVNGEGPVLTPIRDKTGFAALNPNRVAEITAPVLQALTMLRQELPASCTLLGFTGSPFTVLCYMIDGGGSRDFVHTRKLAYQNPVLFGEILDLVTEATAEYLSAQIIAGADAVMLFDSWAGILPPSEFTRHVIEPTARIVNILNAKHPATRIIGFPRLAGMMTQAYAEQTGVDCVGLDTSADVALIARDLDENIALQGNLDPIALIAGGKPMVDQASAICGALKHRPHIFNLGHGILPETPPENVAALLAHIRGL